MTNKHNVLISIYGVTGEPRSERKRESTRRGLILPVSTEVCPVTGASKEVSQQPPPRLSHFCAARAGRSPCRRVRLPPSPTPASHPPTRCGADPESRTRSGGHAAVRCLQPPRRLRASHPSSISHLAAQSTRGTVKTTIWGGKEMPAADRPAHRARRSLPKPPDHGSPGNPPCRQGWLGTL